MERDRFSGRTVLQISSLEDQQYKKDKKDKKDYKWRQDMEKYTKCLIKLINQLLQY